MSSESYWDFLLEEDASIRRVLRNSCRGHHELLEDLYDEVVLHYVPRLFETYDVGKGDIKQYVLRSLRWYCFKWMNRRAQDKTRHYEDVYVHDPEDGHLSVDLGTRDQVQSILTGLSEYNRFLLVSYYLGSMTYQEIAETLGLAKSTVRKHLLIALREARELVKGDRE
jgi:RNA polymerase sigma factor (sigma-70 family)